MTGPLRRAGRRAVRRLDSSTLGNAFSSAKLWPARDAGGHAIFAKPEPGARTAPDGLPIPPEELLLGYSADSYLETGARDVEVMLDVLREGGGDPASVRRVLELGSGPARLTRAVPRHEGGEVWGVDISAPHIRWCQNHLSPPLRFATVTTAPHLPFEDGSFDLALAGSVFTHIDELAEAWLLELRRVVAPGGYVYVTVHDGHTIELLMGPRGREPAHAGLAEALRHFDRQTGVLGRPYRQFAFGVDPGSQVFHDLDDLLARWSMFLDPVATRPEAYGYQTGVLLQKR